MKILNLETKKTAGALLAGLVLPGAAFGCACGCGIFDVGTSSMFPASSGGMAYLNYAFQDQNRNWSGADSAPAANNDDKKIESHFATIGLQYMINRSWGAQLELPFANRTFQSAENAGSLNWTGLGDLRLRGIYTGFSADLSSGLYLGGKLPTGSYSHTEAMGEIDRDTQIGSGSTDVLLGAFHRARFGKSPWNWYAQAELDIPVLKQGGYRPGAEADTAWGVYYDGIAIGRAQISPLVQVIASWRGRDNGPEADTDNSGYQRVLLSPGIEWHWHPIKIYADVELPVYEHVTGNQLVAPALFKLSVSYMF